MFRIESFLIILTPISERKEAGRMSDLATGFVEARKEILVKQSKIGEEGQRN